MQIRQWLHEMHADLVDLFSRIFFTKSGSLISGRERETISTFLIASSIMETVLKPPTDAIIVSGLPRLICSAYERLQPSSNVCPYVYLTIFLIGAGLIVDMKLFNPRYISNKSFLFFKILTYRDARSGVIPPGRKSFAFILIKTEKSGPQLFLIAPAVSATILALPSRDPPHLSFLRLQNRDKKVEYKYP